MQQQESNFAPSFPDRSDGLECLDKAEKVAKKGERQKKRGEKQTLWLVVKLVKVKT